MKTLLITGIGGLTPRSIATIIREKYPQYKIIGIDANNKSMGFFMSVNCRRLVDEYYVCPLCKDPKYFPFIERLVKSRNIDYAFVQPEAEIVEWGDYKEKHGYYPCEVFMSCKTLSESLRDKSIMASLLEETDFIPKTIKVSQENPKFTEIENELGFPCWIRATQGTGGLGSLCLKNIESYKAWLFINKNINHFTISEYLPGRHLANQMLYYNDEYIKGAALECAEYVMANAAPSHVTGNTHFGRFLNEDSINIFCDNCVKYICKKLNVQAHGIFSFDLKENKNNDLKVTEVNIRHMAYTGVMAHVGFDLIDDTMKIMEDGNLSRIERAPFFHYDKPYIFLRDVDVEPIILDGEYVFPKNQNI
ncbi:MAG: hypothetical protein K5907_06515 [Treponema sp.]|nr:hypothetical protein [Treponema sp.]